MTLRVSTDEIVETDTSGVLGVHPSWARVRLREVATVQNGFAFKSGSFSKDRGLPLLRIRDVGANDPDTFIDDDVDPSYVVERGDIVVGMDGDFRAARWDGPPSALNQRVCRVIPTSPNFDSRFLFHTLQPYLDAVNRATSAITVKHLSSATVSDLPVPLPPLAEQERIVVAIEEAFSKLEAGEAGLRTVRKLIKRMRDAVLAAAVTGRLVPQDPTDTPAAKLLADLGVQALDSPGLGMLPESWSWASMGNVTAIGGGIQKQPKRTPIRNPTPFLRVANVGRGTLDLDDVHMIEVFDGELDRYGLERGDLLVVEGNGSPDQIGRSAMWLGSIDPCVHQNHLIRVRPSNVLLPEFLELYWNSPAASRRVQAVASSTSGLHTLSTEKLKVLPVAIPPPEEQARIVSEVDRQVSFLDACEQGIDGCLACAAALRRSVLKAAFEGKLVPQDPSDEPASVLLGRIRAERATAPRLARSKRTA